MSEKENKKSKLSEFLFVLLLIVICIMGIVFYKLHEINTKRQLEINNLVKRVQELENSKQSENTITTKVEDIDKVEDNNILDFGEYLINEVKEDEDGVTNNECSIRIMMGNKFSMYLNWGFWLEGTYEIENNKLICTAEVLSWEGGAGPGSEECKDVITYEILENNTLKLLSIDKNTQNNKNNYSDGFVVGYTYTKQEEPIVKSLELGEYLITDVRKDEGGVSNEECSVTLLENNKFKMYLGYGKSHEGTYEIENGYLICKADKFSSEDGNEKIRKTDAVFSFSLRNDLLFQLENVELNDASLKDTYYKNSFEPGFTYLRKDR